MSQNYINSYFQNKKDYKWVQRAELQYNQRTWNAANCIYWFFLEYETRRRPRIVTEWLKSHGKQSPLATAYKRESRMITANMTLNLREVQEILTTVNRKNLRILKDFILMSELCSRLTSSIFKSVIHRSISTFISQSFGRINHLYNCHEIDRDWEAAIFWRRNQT